ncbi:hypothetical protein [Streptomyces javensis]|uniref:hypothetical protein n=1 Tax=Streptomyces javensis TaxID=114698 RepID=UPI001FE84996|nr:hypothetical protein [Streptomyces javensis]
MPGTGYVAQQDDVLARGAALVRPIDTSLASLKTPSAKALADAALSMDSLQWQQNFLP